MYLFRNKPDFVSDIFGQWYHILFFVLFWLFIAFIIFLYKKGKGETALKVSAIVLLADQIIENTWFWTAPYLEDPLPLYHCRIAKVFFPLVVLFFRKSKYFKQLLITIGLYGSIVALAYPNIDPFSFPHITNIDFFLSHYLIGAIAVLLVLIEKIKPTLRLVLSTQLSMLLFNCFLIVINLMTNKNYGFLFKPPLLPDLLGKLSLPAYTTLVCFVYALLGLIACGIWKAIYVYLVEKE